ncbi:MAG TPA: SPOR domain-containing protein [Candidatus Eisenbacteria bacterium]|nr:SPOR domain-containing protein [Candidatus Eisenbacteria bacterium]
MAVLVLGAAAAAFAPRAHAADPNVTARASIVVDAASGETLWERGADWPLPPASTTKVLTAIIALESGRLDDYFAVSVDASETAPSKIGLRPGDRMALGDLLYAVLLNSANDAATVVAEGLAGSESAFATRMNAKAHAIGAQGSHFVNPHGLTADGHVSTARDLAKIFRYGLHVREFREILETPRIKVPLQSKRVQTVTLHSHNRLLTGYTYPVIGKTGYTRAAGRCFVGAATSGGREIVIALLGSSDLWGDARRLFAFGFGEPMEGSPTIMASASRSRGRGVTTEGDEDLATRDGKSGVRVASIPKSRTRAPEATADVSSELGSTRYVVRLGPYKTRREAETTRNRLARSGFRGRVVGQALVMGDFPRRESADRLAKGLRVKGYRPTIVARR